MGPIGCGKSRGKPYDILPLRPRFEAVTFQILSRSVTHSEIFSVDMKVGEGGGRGGESNNIRLVEHENKIRNSTENTVQFQISRAGKRIAWPSI
jgi:hypothetical protein